MKRILLTLLILNLLLAVSLASPLSRAPQVLITDFEVTPGYLGGKPEIWGSAYPLSGFMSLFSSEFNPRFVHTGSTSFKLVNSPRTKENWGSFSINLGPILDATTFPITVRTLDVSHYKYFTFWIRGEKGGEHFKVIFRDAHSKSYLPTLNYTPPNNVVTADWKQIDVPLHQLDPFSEKYEKRELDLTQLVVVGVEFGDNTGNARGDTLFLDDLVFRRD